MGEGERERRRRWPDRREVGLGRRLAAEVQPGYRAADVRAGDDELHGREGPALQQDRSRLEHLVPRDRRLRCRGADPEHLRERSARQRRPVGHRPLVSTRRGRQHEHRAPHRRLLHPRHDRRRPDLWPGAGAGRDPGGHERARRRRHDASCGHPATDRDHRHQRRSGRDRQPPRDADALRIRYPERSHPDALLQHPLPFPRRRPLRPRRSGR